MTDNKRVGRKRITSYQTYRLMTHAVMKDRRTPLKDMASDFSELRIRVSSRTVRRRLCEAELKAKTPRKKPFLNAKQRRKRAARAKEHILWTVDLWKKSYSVMNHAFQFSSKMGFSMSV